MSKKEKKLKAVEEPVVLDIPDDEIWTYRVEGLAAPHIGKPYKNAGIKKVLLALVIIVAVSLSCYFSVRTVQKDTFEYKQLPDGTYELSKFSNTGFIRELDIDFVSGVEYDRENPDANTNFTLVKDESKKITSIYEYAFNCDEKVRVINIGESVEYIDSKAFYSCWALRQIEVDENNPNYCDVDGVLYNKDKTEIICYPCDHDSYLADKYGWAEYDDYGGRIEPDPSMENYQQYVRDVMTYVVPSSVETIGELCFNYAHMAKVYVPEGLKIIEPLAFFEIPRFEQLYTYASYSAVEDTRYTDDKSLGEVYPSLPEGLEYIGSDAFSYNQAMNYVYIPSSVTYIGHHAFWDCVYKRDGELVGITVINTAMSQEQFKKIYTGDQWRPQYDYLLFKKSVDINYGAERISPLIEGETK